MSQLPQHQQLQIRPLPYLHRIWSELGHSFMSRLACVFALILTSCRQAATTICPRPSPPSVGAEAPPSRPRMQSADHNVAVGSHGQHVPTLTAEAA